MDEKTGSPRSNDPKGYFKRLAAGHEKCFELIGDDDIDSLSPCQTLVDVVRCLRSLSASNLTMTQKEAVRDVLHANKAHQQALKTYAERLEAELKAADKLIAAVEVQDRESDDDTGQGLVLVDGAVKPTSIVPPSALLSEDSPFYDDVLWKKRYDDCVNSVPMKAKEHDALTDAVRIENQRIYALAAQSRGEQPFTTLRSLPLSYFEQNKEGIDWNRVSKKVSESIPSGAPRSAKECEIRWLGYLHPDINKDPWTSEEIERLRLILMEKGGQTIDWVEVSKQLGGNRVPLDCMRQGHTRRTHHWTPDTDKRLLEAVEVYGQHNWQLVAKTVSEDATAQQCQKRYNDTLDPNLRRGAWTEDEDSRLSRAVAAFTDTPVDELRKTFAAVKLADRGIPWQDVALFVPGRNNNQCRERFQILMNPNDKNSKPTWSEEDDEKLISIVEGLGGPGRWKEVAEALGGGRIDAQCRKRYETVKKRRESAMPPPNSLPLQTILDAETGDSISVGSKRLKGKEKAKAFANVVPNPDTGSEGTSSTQPAGERPKPRPRGRPRKNPGIHETERNAGASSAPSISITRTSGADEHQECDPGGSSSTLGSAARQVVSVGASQLPQPSSTSSAATGRQGSRKRKRGAQPIEGEEPAEDNAEDEASPTKKTTGRTKSRAKTDDDTLEFEVEPQESETVDVSKGRGGRRKTKEAKQSALQGLPSASELETSTSVPTKRKRGRPRKKLPTTEEGAPEAFDAIADAIATASQADKLPEKGGDALEQVGRAEAELNEDLSSRAEDVQVAVTPRRRSTRLSRPK